MWLAREMVPATDRVFSIFEPHTELIKCGRCGKPFELGHVILLGQTNERFITQFNVMREKIHDSLLNQGIVDKHEESFEEPPETLVADKGFRGKTKPVEDLAERVDNAAIPRALKDWVDPEFVHLHHFRAGIEGSISVRKVIVAWRPPGISFAARHPSHHAANDPSTRDGSLACPSR